MSESQKGRPALLTDQELDVIERLGHAAAAFMALPEHHPMDLQDFCAGMHALQHQVMARAAVRAYPGLFTSMSPLRRDLLRREAQRP